MDTKSKKSEFRNIYKFIALALTLVFAFFSGFEALAAVRANFFYKTPSGSIKDTVSFLSDIRSDLLYLSQYCKFESASSGELTLDEFIETTNMAKSISADYTKRTKDALEIYNTIMKLKKLKPADADTDSDLITDYEDYDDYEENVTYIYSTYSYSYGNEYSGNSTISSDGNYDRTDTSDSFDRSILAIKNNYTSASDWETDYANLRSVLFCIVNDATSETSIKNELNRKMNSELNDAYSQYCETRDTYEQRVSKYTNFKFLVINNTTKARFSNLDDKNISDKDFISSLDKDSAFYISFDGKALHSPTATYDKKSGFINLLTESVIASFEPVNESTIAEQFRGYTVYVKITNAPEKGDAYYNLVSSFNSVSGANRNSFTVLAVIFAVLSCACLVVLCRMSGRRKDGSVKLVFTDKALFVVHFAALCFALFFSIAALVCVVYGDYSGFFHENTGLMLLATPQLLRVCAGIGLSLTSLIVTTFVLYIVRNCKADTFQRRFILGLLGIAISNAKSHNKELGTSLRLVKRQTVAIIVGYMGINAFYMLLAFSCDSDGASFILFLLFLLFNAFALIYIIRYVGDVLKLTSFADEIKNGNFELKIDPENYVKPLRKLAADLSDCRDSIELAVNEAVKGEHMKTELITNVSHDLKTPLTSIINYVALLKLCDIQGEDERKYLDILDEKSRKLQRLIEDLTEASKATSGNIKMNIAVVNLYELALQAVGESSDVLENAGLDLILNEKTSDIFVSADSQHTFRVIDNLFSNAKKYSLPGSRVYVDVYKENGYGVISVKNVSKEKLNVQPDELTERFVRGDNSRTTDGSGLGLSIARSFTELQHGEFILEIDGDLFKASVKLPLYDMPEAAPAEGQNAPLDYPTDTSEADYVSAIDDEELNSADNASATESHINIDDMK